MKELCEECDINRGTFICISRRVPASTLLSEGDELELVVRFERRGRWTSLTAQSVLAAATPARPLLQHV